MKVTPTLFLINSLGTGGAEKAVVSAASLLATRGHQIRILCLERARREIEHPHGVPVEYLSGLSAAAHPVIKFVLLPLLGRRLSRYLARHGGRIVFSHLFRANFVNVLARTLAGSRHKAILVNHTRVSRLRHEGIQGRVNWNLSRRLYPKADLVASVSRGSAVECEQLLGLPKGMSIPLYDPVDAPSSEGVSRTRHPRAIAAVGRLVALKRFDDLIQAFASVVPEYADLELHVVGEGPERAFLERRAADTGAGARIRFHGQMRDPSPVVALCDVFVSSSETEGFGMAIVEALAAGVPVIASDCAYGPREILSPGSDPTILLGANSGIELAEFGILYPVGSVRSLEAALRRLLSNPHLRAELAKRGRRRAVDFSPSKVIAAYESLIAQSL